VALAAIWEGVKDDASATSDPEHPWVVLITVSWKRTK
jgi:hypothetical protein